METDLFGMLLKEFALSNPGEAAVRVAENFVKFARSWFNQGNVAYYRPNAVGMNGLALVLKDGKTYPLCKPAEQTPMTEDYDPGIQVIGSPLPAGLPGMQTNAIEVLGHPNH